MSSVDRWLLPDGVEEVLPPYAAHLEAVRRRVLDAFASAGYEFVETPMVEYLESLLTGTGHDLDLKTFKVTDQLSGRTMGIRADMTPQVARIDAHSLGRGGVTRLCYAGTVLHAMADNQLASRSPISVGAELFGETGTGGDLEIVSLMIATIQSEQIAPVHIELGDVGIFRDLVDDSSIEPRDEDLLFAMIQRKDTTELERMLASLPVPDALAARLSALPGLCGSQDVLDRAQSLFSDHGGISRRLENLVSVVDGLRARFPEIDLYFDLSELRGYAYHTGIVFAAYIGGSRLAKGGRYDDVGSVFGRPRPATGFDLDLKALAQCSNVEPAASLRVSAPRLNGGGGDERSRWAFIQSLREDGYVVIEDRAPDCEWAIAFDGGQWKLVEQSSGA